MSPAEATATAQITVRDSVPERDRQALRRLAEQCEPFSPYVGLENAKYPECLLLDITGLSHLFGNEQQIAAKVFKFFAGQGLAVRLGLAHSIGLAWALAHFGQQLPQGPWPASLASYQAPTLLASLPVAALRLPAETLQLLHDLGIQHVGQVQALPRDSLLARFGPQLALRLDQLTGQTAESFTPCRPTLALEVEQFLEEPIRDHCLITKVLDRLVKKLMPRLQARDQGVLQLLCKFTCVNRQVVSLPVFLFQPSMDTDQVMELVELNLEQLQLPDDILSMSVSAPLTSGLLHAQKELFATGKSTDGHDLALLVNRLSNRLGSDQVLFPRCRSAHLPERKRNYVPAIQAQRAGSRLPALVAQDRWRPLLLYQRPRAIRAIAVAPLGPPEAVWLAGRREPLKSAEGPERIETGWWRGASTQRDYYRIETETGSRWWIFRRLRDGQWFLQGEYA